MKMGRTLFQIMRDRVGSPAELRVYNPLKLKINDQVLIDAIDLRNFNYKVSSIRENNRIIDGRKFQSVDYQLNGIGNLAGSTERNKVRLRLNPMDMPDPISGLTHNVIALSLYYECGFKEAKDQGLMNAVNASTGEFEIDWNGKRKYWRINDVMSPYTTSVRVLEDMDGNGIVDSDEIREQGVEYWDYHTELLNEANQKYIEFLFVEKSKSDGWFQIWKGSEINSEKVTAI